MRHHRSPEEDEFKGKGWETDESCREAKDGATAVDSGVNLSGGQGTFGVSSKPETEYSFQSREWESDFRANKKVGNESVKAIGLDHSKWKKEKNGKVVNQVICS